MTDEPNKKSFHLPVQLPDGFITFSFSGDSTHRQTTMKMDHITGHDLANILFSTIITMCKYPGADLARIRRICENALTISLDASGWNVEVKVDKDRVN